MVPTAFILYTAEFGYENEALKAIRKAEGVEYAHATYGAYDGIAKLRAETMDKLRERNTKIRRIDRVRSSMMMMVVEE